jgi:hypothetical protein
MNSNSFKREETGAVEILEQAVDLLRFAPIGAFLTYYIGTLPFVLGFLFFCTDMSCGATAGSHLPEASLGLAVLYLWMKCWQAAFAARLQGVLEDAPRPTWPMRHIARLVCLQLAITAWGLPCLTLALVVALPFGWCYAFFQNLTTLGGGERAMRSSTRSAWRQAFLWPAQNHKLILILSLFSLVAFLNVCFACALVPAILRSFAGMDIVVAGSSFFLNPTFLLSMAGITYLCINPLTRAAYVLRCHYGESLASGRDLLIEIKRLGSAARKGAALLIAIVALCLFFCDGARAAAVQAGPGNLSQIKTSSISARSLDKAIDRVVNRLEFTWRFPPPKNEDKNRDGFISRAMDTVCGYLDRLWTRLLDLVERFGYWLSAILPNQPEKPSSSSMLGDRRLWLILLPGCAALILLALLRRIILRRKQAVPVEPLETMHSGQEPDLREESVSPEELASSQWSRLGEKLLDQGETRTALRAFYFSTLASLAEKELLTVSGYKSNRDYEREVKRRAHFSPGLGSAFSENVSILERTWYGMHPAEVEAVDRFLTNYRWMSGYEQKG